MNRKWNVMAILAAIMLVATASLAAQTSNTFSATSGIFTSDVDNYSSVTNFGKVALDKWFGFTKLDSADANTGARAFDLGYARKFDALYLAAYYSGAILQQSSATVKEDVITTPTIDSYNNITSTTTQTTKTLTDATINSSNKGTVLFGVGGMGFKLGFAEYHANRYAPATDTYSGAAITTISDVTTVSSTSVTTSKVYSNLSYVKGYMTPSLEWGTNVALGDMTFVPKIGASLKMNQDSSGNSYAESTTKGGSAVIGSTTTNRTNSWKGDYLEPIANISLKLKGAKVDGNQAQFELAYALDMPLYDTNGLKSTTNYTKTTNTLSQSKTETYQSVWSTKKTGMTHGLTPTFTFTKDLSDQVSVGFNVKAAVSYATAGNSDSYTSTTTTVTDQYTTDVADDSTVVSVYSDPVQTSSSSSETFIVAPSLNAGFVYKVVPSKFEVKGGLNVAAPKFKSVHTTYTDAEPSTTVTTTTTGANYTTTTNSIGGTTRDEYSSLVTSWDALSSTVYFGSTFYFTDKFALDLYTSLGTSGTSSLFGTAGNSPLTNSLSLSFTIKN